MNKIESALLALSDANVQMCDAIEEFVTDVAKEFEHEVGIVFNKINFANLKSDDEVVCGFKFDKETSEIYAVCNNENCKDLSDLTADELFDICYFINDKSYVVFGK